jgi:uncharacterized protein (DUF1778 family)
MSSRTSGPNAQPATTRSTRFEMRMSPYVRKIVEHAAELQGRSMSDFIVAAAEEAARRAIEDARVIELSVDEQRRFADALLNPPTLGEAWTRARDSHRKLIAESR